MSRATVQVMRYANPDYHPQITSQVKVLKWWFFPLQVLSNIGLAGKWTPELSEDVFPIKKWGKDRLPTTIFPGANCYKLRRCTF